MSTIGVTRSEKTASGALALAMHALFAVLLFFGVAWQQKRSGEPVVVDLWTSLPPAPQPKIEAPPEAKPRPEPPKPVPKVEPKPAVKPDIALKEKLEKERKLKAQAEAQRREDENRKQAEARKREEDNRKRLAALKEQQAKEAEAKRIAREQEEALRKLAAQQAAQASAGERLIDDYKRRIGDKIRRFVVLPPNLQGNPEAEFEVVQIPGGEVLSVKLKRSSGNSAYDAAVERAIHKAQPLPPPPQGFAFGEFRELSLKFRPKE